MTGPLCIRSMALVAVASLLPAVIAENAPEDKVLAPNDPYHVQVAIGEAKFLRFSCMGGPADVVISLSTYAEKADPLLFLSLNPAERPTSQKHDSSNFGQWREDDAGDHYVIAKGVSPEGGILGIVNVRPFAREELHGILTIQCTYIIAFDGLFWDHLRSREVCPIGGDYKMGEMVDPERFCSGHGQCVDHGVCECNGDRTGAACEHKKNDIVTAAEGKYRFSLDSGKYQYFRVRVPTEFPGGFLEVQTWGERPLVVLVRGDGLPTKSNFELSNFDDWISERNTSILRFQVPAFAGIFSSGDHIHRRLKGGGADCPDMGFQTHVPGCRTRTLNYCEGHCRYCTGCVKGRDGPQCAESCKACTTSVCKEAFSVCAGDLSCQGREAMYCKSRCGGCIACLDSNDPKCGNCECCLDCLPVAAKCGALGRRPEDQTHYIFVGVYNHRRYFNDVRTVYASADVVLKLDPKFAQREMPSTWLADLYDRFHDLSHFKSGESEVYPEGEQYIYELDPLRGKEVHQQVRVYRDRMTLLHIPNEDFADRLMLSFVGSNVSHVLVSTRAAPKTLFDFNAAPNVRPGRPVEISAGGEPALWVAIFGNSNGWADVRADKIKEETPIMTMDFALFLKVGIVISFIGMGCIFGGVSFGETFGFDPSVPLSHRLWCFVTRKSLPHESTAALTREGSMSGFVSSDVIDQSIEDQFLLRGGMGDDGI